MRQGWGEWCKIQIEAKNSRSFSKMWFWMMKQGYKFILLYYIPQTSPQSDAWYIEWLWIKARCKALTVCGFFVFVFWYTMLLRVVNRKEKKHYCESFFLKADKSQFYHNPSHHIFNFSLFLIFLLFKAGQNILSFFHLRYHIRF